MTAKPLDDHDEILLRQIHPTLYDNEVPASGQFAPSPKDDNRLSVDRGRLTSAEASYVLYWSNGFKSAAVYGVSVGEFGAEQITCVSDPLEATDKLHANPAHAYADFSAFTSASSKRIAKRLRNLAMVRGRLHPPS